MEIFAAQTQNEKFLSQLSELLDDYSSDSYFSEMTVTIGESEINVDGASIPIDK